MLPTFSPRDGVAVSHMPYLLSAPSVEDIVLLRNPYTDRIIIKRIIAGPLSVVDLDGNSIVVNGVPREKRMPDGVRQYHRQQWNVPEESYFVTGDNLYQSTDSRHFGFIPREHIIGKVVKHFALN